MECPNQECRKIFTKPLKVINLHDKDAGPYDACPYCFTEITAGASEKAEQIVQTIERQDSHTKAIQEPTEAESVCAHEFGYLSRRSKKEGIPDECMLCERIVKCMLNKITQ